MAAAIFNYLVAESLAARIDYMKKRVCKHTLYQIYLNKSGLLSYYLVSVFTRRRC